MKQLKIMYDGGVLSEEEYNREKAKIIDNL
ncbi:SHOCT domain-containing protein [Clostridium sp. Marseille-P2415]